LLLETPPTSPYLLACRDSLRSPERTPSLFFHLEAPHEPVSAFTSPIFPVVEARQEVAPPFLPPHAATARRSLCARRDRDGVPHPAPCEWSTEHPPRLGWQSLVHGVQYGQNQPHHSCGSGHRRDHSPCFRQRTPRHRFRPGRQPLLHRAFRRQNWSH